MTNNKEINLRKHFDLLETKEGLEEMAKLIAKKYWNMELDIPVLVNVRMTRWYGAFNTEYIRDEKTNKVIGHKALNITISGFAYRNFTKYAMLDLLKHEVCHWACFKMGKPSSDGSIFFESELKRINSTPTGKDMTEKGYADKARHKRKQKEKSRKSPLT